MNNSNSKYLLQMKNITKRFPGVLALDNVSFDLKPHEVHVMVGENGAGKSTLIKILSGAYKMDEGEIFIDDEIVKINDTHHAMQLGIATCYQELNLIPLLTAAKNIYLGRFPKLANNILPFINNKKIIKDAQEIIDSIGVNLNVRKLVTNMKIAEQQMVEIAKALSVNAKIYILDEPTAVLSYKEIDELFNVIHKLKESGFGIIYISHRLEEIKKIGDRVTVLRDGRKVGNYKIDQITVDEMVEKMVGRNIKDAFPKRESKSGSVVLKTSKLSREKSFDNINITLKEGEVVGLAGLVGAGRTEVARGIFAADEKVKGKIYINSKEVSIRSPKDAVKSGVAYLPEDRKELGVVINMSVKDNIMLASFNSFSKAGVINNKKINKKSKELVDKLRIKTPGLYQKVKNLSGGNQQKIVVAKWLASGCKIFLFDEPTRGIDVGAKIEVYKLMNELAKQGATILMVSSEMPEIINMCDRVYVMRSGRIEGELKGENINQKSILNLAMLGKLSNGRNNFKKEVKP